MFGVATSTVAGRLRITLCSGVGFQTSITASQTSLANSSSVALKVSGEYSNCHWVSGCWAAYLTNSLAAFTAISFTPSLSWSNTMRRNDGQVALYRWTMAFFAPRRDSKVRAMRSSRAWVSTWMVVSSGMWPSSMRVRTKSKSVCEAAGNDASISLTPTATRVFQKRSFLTASIGSISDWLPSRRSELHQIGAAVMVFDGQVRSGRLMVGKARYLEDGSLSMLMGGILIVVAGKRRPAGGSNGGGSTAWTGCRDSARQSCADEAQAAVLAKLDEGVRGFHAFNPNRVGGGSQAVGKN
ncbi:protein of unknown function [Pseudomonas mediterranea]